MKQTYDSTKDTKKHIDCVQRHIDVCVQNLKQRGNIHDASKLLPPEKEVFDEMTPKLKDCTYGSEEYKGYLNIMQSALQHHYTHNPHHPEHWENGVNDMSLLDLLEMLCDWKAASERHADGDISKSLDINAERFKISPQVQNVLQNTIKELGWI